MFLSFLIANTKAVPETDPSVELMNKAFAIFPEVDFILLFCPLTAKLAPYILSMFTEIEGSKLPPGMDSTKIFVAHRSKFVPKLQVREAVIEDNDDLLPILQSCSPHIVAGQDEFFLAQLIQSQDERNRIFVGVERNRPVGMLSTSLDVNVSFIKNVFDLSNYPDIISETKVEMKSPSIVVLVCGSMMHFDDNALYNMVVDLQCVFIDAEDIIDDPLETPIEESLSKLKHAIFDAMGDGDSGKSCIVSGFPRSLGEVEAFLQSDLSFDAVVRFRDNANPATDVAAIAHVDAVEEMRSKLAFDSTRIGSWSNVDVDNATETEAIAYIEEEIRKLLRRRQEEIFSILTLAGDGPSANAFAVTVFAINEKCQSRAEDLLRVAFEEHPSLQYAVLLMPNTAAKSSLSNCMTYVRMKAGASFDQSLYIMHRDCMLANEYLAVRRYIPAFAESIQEFLVPMGEYGETVLDAAKSSLSENTINLADNPGEVCFVVTLDNDLVGVVTLSRTITSAEDIEWIRANFQMDEFVNYERHRSRAQATITNFVISPIFSSWSRFVLREVMRYYGKSLLYYQSDGKTSIPDDLVGELIPVRPRRRMQQHPGKEASAYMLERPSSANVATRSNPLFFTTKRLLSDPRGVLPTRIVVVGGSKCAYSILETLCFIPYLHLLNIYFVEDASQSKWISPDSSSAASKLKEEQIVKTNTQKVDVPSFFPNDEDESFEQEFRALGLQARVTLVNGRLTDIDRKSKVIIISDSIPLEYDVLIISGAVQDSTFKSCSKTANTHPAQLYDKGIFSLGNGIADNAASTWLFGPHPPRSLGVIIYGSGMNAWSVIGRLLQKELSPDRITWILPNVEFTNGELGHETIDEIAQMALKKSGIRLMVGYKLEGIDFTETGKVCNINLSSMPGSPSFPKYEERRRRERERAERQAKYQAEKNEEFWKIEEKVEAVEIFDEVVMCGTLLLCEKLHADIDVFSAVNDAGLIYDGGIVVDNNFCTTDPFIFAAGNCTKFSRIYTDAVKHDQINARELGTFVGLKVIETHLDTLLEAPRAQLGIQQGLVDGIKLVSFDQSSLDRGRNVFSQGAHQRSAQASKPPLPTFSLPKTQSMILPGGKLFFRSRLPSIRTKDTISMVTGGPDTEQICVVKVR